MLSFWLWWWKKSVGDTSESVIFRHRLDEAIKVLCALFIRAFRFLEPRLVLVVSLGAFVAAIIVAWNIPVFHRIWGDEFWDAKNGEGVRDLVLAATTLVGALIGLAGYLLLAVRTNAVQRQTELQREAQITDRFTKAVEQLGSRNEGVRAGAIYALERLSVDSERDAGVIMETLAAFVRQVSVNTLGRKTDCVDIGAAVSVLARRIGLNSNFRKRHSAEQLNLSKANLAGLTLRSFDLSGFILSESDFSEGNLKSVKLDKTDLHRANFSNASLEEVSFDAAQAPLMKAQKTQFYNCSIVGARISWAEFQGADFILGNLSGANADGVDFSNCSFWSAKLDDVSAHHANFSFCVFSDVSMRGSIISSTNFLDAEGLTTEMLKGAKFSVTQVPRNVPSGVELPPPDGRLP